MSFEEAGPSKINPRFPSHKSYNFCDSVSRVLLALPPVVKRQHNPGKYTHLHQLLFDTKSEYTFPTRRRRKSAKRIDTISQKYLSLLKMTLLLPLLTDTIGLHEIPRMRVIDFESWWISDAYLVRSKWNKEKDRKIEATGIQNEILFCLKNKTKQNTKKKHHDFLLPLVCKIRLFG